MSSPTKAREALDAEVSAPEAEDGMSTTAAVEAAPPRSDRVTVIKPATGWLQLDLKELWAYRELAFTFAWRDFKVRYKQTYIGIVWAILQPFGQMLVAVIIFGRFASFPADGAYPLFVFSGLLLWGYFTGALTRASNSLVSNVGFVTKIYFPRVLLPFASVVSPLVDLVFSSLVLVLLMVKYHAAPGWTVVFAPVFLVLAMLTALGAGLFLAAINVRYRDVPYTLPYLIQIWAFIGPVYYAAHGIPHRWQWILSINPMTGVLTGFRWSLYSEAPAPPLSQLATSLGVMVAMLFIGLLVFKRQEPRFADNI